MQKPTRDKKIRFQKKLIGLAFLLTLLSMGHTKTGYTDTDEVVYFGWPFPITNISHNIVNDFGHAATFSNSGSLMFLGFIASLLYWYGMSYLLVLVFQNYFPESYSVMHTHGGDRMSLSDSGWMKRRLHERFPPKDVEFTYFDENKEYSEEYKEYLGEQYMWRGLSHLVYGFFEAAARDFDRVLKLKTPDAESYYRRGYAYSWVDNHQRAIQDYDKAIELDPRNARYWYLRGKSHFLLGNIIEAKHDLMMTLEIFPEHGAASRILADIEKTDGPD